MSNRHTIRLPADLPYDPLRGALYTRDELMAGWPGETLDVRIQRHVLDNGFRSPPVDEALAQRLHDHHVDAALSAFLCAERDWRRCHRQLLADVVRQGVADGSVRPAANPAAAASVGAIPRGN